MQRKERYWNCRGSRFEKMSDMNLDKEREVEMEIAYCKYYLLKSFPESFINERDEFIAYKRTNTYICLGDCKKPIDIECKVIEWFSRPASKGMPYSQEWRNRQFRKFILDGINDFLETNFTESDMGEIYQYLGNASAIGVANLMNGKMIALRNWQNTKPQRKREC